MRPQCVALWDGGWEGSGAVQFLSAPVSAKGHCFYPPVTANEGRNCHDHQACMAALTGLCPLLVRQAAARQLIQAASLLLRRVTSLSQKKATFLLRKMAICQHQVCTAARSSLLPASSTVQHSTLSPTRLV